MALTHFWVSRFAALYKFEKSVFLKVAAGVAGNQIRSLRKCNNLPEFAIKCRAFKAPIFCLHLSPLLVITINKTC